jgi:hypothetical protein
MSTSLKRTLVAALVALAFFGRAASHAHAQYYGCYGYCPYPSYGYSPYYSPYLAYADPYGGDLSGAADVINAQGQYMKSAQQANLTRQYVDREKTGNQRRAFDEWLYEQRLTPTPEDVRERNREQELRYARNDPPATEIYAATPLNLLLDDLQRLEDLNIPGPRVPLDPAVLEQINVAPPGVTGNVGLIKNKGQLEWPLALRGPFFQTNRDTLNRLTPQLVKQVAGGKLDIDTLNEVLTAVSRMRRELGNEITYLPPMQYIHGKVFVDNFQNALKALQQPEAANFFNGKWAAKGDTVADLVRYMTEQGLLFAPAVPGQEAAYTALYQALAHYDIASNLLATRRLPPANKE